MAGLLLPALFACAAALVPESSFFAAPPTCNERHGYNTSACLDDTLCAVSSVVGENMCIEYTPERAQDDCVFPNRTEIPTCSIPLGEEKATKRPLAPSPTNGYSEDTCLRYVHLAGAAYCSVADIQTWGCKQCVTDFKTDLVMNDDQKELRGFIGTSSEDGATVISFRGTVMTIKDWLDDLDVVFTEPYSDLPDVKVHKGFYDTYQWFKPQIMAYLQKVKPTKLVITGHSLGGALATVCAFDLVHAEGHKVDEVWTFGEPRDGNSDFAKTYGEAIATHYRVTHDNDIVPHVPLEAEGYYHVAREVYYPDQDYVPGHYKICDGSGEDKSCSDGNLLNLSVDDHLHYLGITLGTNGC